MSKHIGLYIHIPFCKSKCNYCDFNSYPQKEALFAPYFDALKKEILIRSENMADFEIRTIFIGGGTPSVVDTEYIYGLLNICRQNFNIARNAEISIESNPGTLSYEKLVSYKICGVNRLSIGLQAWQDKLLMEMGRIHNHSDFLENLKLAVKAGFENINVDLIFGLPGQTLEDWTETIINVMNLGITHVSCYSLKIEDDTVFGERLREGLLQEADDELDREMYRFAVDKLLEYGFMHYEISNFAKKSFECKHNLVYWNVEEYLGIGAGAHSYLENKRSNNKYGVEEYLNAVSNLHDFQQNVQIIGKAESMSEYLILGLRLIDGVSAGEFRSRYGEELFDIFGKQIAKHIKKQLLEQENDRIRLTRFGLDIANEVFSDFICSTT